MFVDGSARFGKVGVGIFSKIYKERGRQAETNEHARLSGVQNKLTIQYAELVALEEALDLFIFSWDQTENQGIRKLNIYSDCKLALQALHNPKRQSGQSVLRRVLQKIESIRVVGGPEGVFQRVPAHSKVEGNERADALAKSVTAGQRTVLIPPDDCDTLLVASHALAKIKNLYQEHWEKTYIAAKGVDTRET